jgi:hypothetical protein
MSALAIFPCLWLRSAERKARRAKRDQAAVDSSAVPEALA